jgi:hypothetical protein
MRFRMWKKTEGTDFQAGVSMDQIAAKELSQQTQLASLELALENTAELVGACDIGYSCAYSGTIAWRSPTTPLPMEMDPRAVFERMFGDNTEPKARLARIQKERSILDAATHDVTRLQKRLGARDVTEVGVNEAHHPVSHHANVPGQLEKLSRINLFHMKNFAYLLDKLQSTPDGDGSLLDHSMILYGAGFSNSNEHYPHDLPLMVVGGGAGQLKGGRLLRFKNDPPLANLHLTLLDKMGMNVERFGDSTGKLELPSDV